VLGESDHSSVSVENPVRADDGNIGELLSTLRWIESYPNPADAYRARLLEIAAQASAKDAGKLGLVRVAYEGNCALRADVSGSTLRVTADLRREAALS
jgi:hypothetical protein